LPDEALLSEAGYFEDAACKQRLYQRADRGGTPMPSVEALRFVEYAPAGDAITNLRRVKAYSGPLYRWYDGSCERTSSGDEQWLAVGAPIPLDSLAEVEETEL
jgi:hypothetical protein